MENEKIFQMPFSKLYGLLQAKAARKGRSSQETDTVISWLTGYSSEQLHQMAQTDLAYGDFFRQAPAMNPDRMLVTGKICGVRIEDIQDPLMRDIRILDRLVDELARGRPMQKILRQA